MQFSAWNGDSSKRIKGKVEPVHRESLCEQEGGRGCQGSASLPRWRPSPWTSLGPWQAFSPDCSLDKLVLPEVVDPRDLVGGDISAACTGNSCDGKHTVWRRNKWDQMLLQQINIMMMMMRRWNSTSSLESWAIGWLAEDHLGACNNYLHHDLHHQQSCKMSHISQIYPCKRIDNLDDW